MNENEILNYLEKRGFDGQTQKEWNLEPYNNSVKINYHDKDGNLLYTRLNQLTKEPKYLSPQSDKMPGGHSWLYGLHMARYITDKLVLVEGEYNCISCWLFGIYAFGVPGQSMALKDYHLEQIPKTVKKIVILYDEPKFAEARAKEILEYFDYEKEVYIAKYPGKPVEGKKYDANDYLVNGLNEEFKMIINTADRFFGDKLKSTSIKVKIDSNDFIESYCNDYASQISDAPRKYQELMGMSVISTVLNRKVYLNYGIYNLYPNLYVVLLGKSTVMRKSHALNMAKYLISKVNDSLILPNDFTPEGLFNLLVDNPSGIISWSEFGAFLVNANAKTYQAGIKEFLTESYDCPKKINKRLSSNEFTINNVYLNIITASTIDWFTENIIQRDIFGGFLGRFIYIPCTPEDKDKWYPMPNQVDQKVINKLLLKLKAISNISGEMKLSDEAKVIQIKWLRRHEEDISNIDDSKGITSFYSRLSDYLLKFAMLYEISSSNSSNSLTISENSMLRAVKLVNWLKESLSNLINKHVEFSKEGREINRILRIIEEKKTISRANLLMNSHLSAKKLDEILSTLLQSEQIKQTFIQESRKKTTVYQINITA